MVIGAYNQNGDQNGIDFYRESPEKSRTKEELLLDTKRAYVEIVDHEVQNRLTKEVKKLNNERFHFGNEYDDIHNDPDDTWFNCEITN